jgi:hypothetical protein
MASSFWGPAPTSKNAFFKGNVLLMLRSCTRGRKVIHKSIGESETTHQKVILVVR